MVHVYVIKSCFSKLNIVLSREGKGWEFVRMPLCQNMVEQHTKLTWTEIRINFHLNFSLEAVQ